MPKLEKTLQGNLDIIEKKINHGVLSICPMTGKRDRWETTVGGVRCVMLVYEKYAMPVLAHPDKLPEDWDKDYNPSWFNIYARDAFDQAPHFSMVVTMLDDGEEIKLCGITSGSGQAHLFSPDTGGEYDLYEALDITLEILDQIVVDEDP